MPARLWRAPGIGTCEIFALFAKAHEAKLIEVCPSTFDPADLRGLPATGAIDGAGTGRDHLFFNQGSVAAMDYDGLKGLIVREVMHIALNHHTGRGHRGPGSWNRADDFATNAKLIEQGFELSCPAPASYDSDYAGMSTGAIYGRFRKEEDQNQQPGA